MNLNKKLSDILDPNKIEVVKNPIEKAHGLPNECYLNDDYLEFEKEKIFKNNWTMIGVASSVPNPGDAKPFNLLGIPILIVRNKNNEVKVFHNVCSHRGFKLVDQECKLKNVIRCPYHSGLMILMEINSYSTYRRLGKHDVEGFDKNNSSLKKLNQILGWI
jgi:choline monooxygenase